MFSNKINYVSKVRVYIENTHESFLHKVFECPKLKFARKTTVLLSFLFVSFFASAQCDRQSDSLELVRFYNATNGANWTEKWDLNQNMDTWFGLTLTGDGCVSTLLLQENNLSGELIDFDLPFLFEIRLTGNSIADSIPNFSNLPRLELLILNENDFSGDIPNFTGTPFLRILNLDRNNLTGGLPDFTSIPNLTLLRFQYNQISGNIPDFTNLPNLLFFSAINNNMSGPIPDFTNTPFMHTIQFHNNNLTGPILDFTGLPNLRIMSFEGNNLSGTVPDFQNLPNLTRIGLRDNNLTGSIPDFSAVPEVDRILFKNNNMTGTIPNFSNVPKLLILAVENNDLEGHIPDFSNTPIFKDLYANGNRLTGTMPDFGSISSDANMERIYIYNNSFTFEGLISSLDANEIAADLAHIYAPQKEFSKDSIYYAKKGDTIRIDLLEDASLTTNNYTWTKDLANFSPDPMNNANSNLLFLPNIDLQAVGKYQAAVTNSNVPGLTLRSVPISVKVCDAQSDSTELIRLYNATAGASWTNSTNWLQPGLPFSTWFGITTDSFGCVRKIDLSNNNLDGTLPDLDLNTLDTLILHGNNLNSPIPSTLHTPYLINLDLSENQLSGAIPPGIGTMTRLKVLNLNDNILSSVIPPVLGDLCETEELRLGGNNFTGELPIELTMLQNLQIGRVDFSNNQIDSLKPKIAFFCPFGDTILENTPSYNRFLGICNVQCIGTEWDDFTAFSWIPDTLASVNCLSTSCPSFSAQAGYVDVRGIKVIFTREVCFQDLANYTEEVLFYDCGGNLLETATCDQDQFCTQFGAISETDFRNLKFDSRWNCGTQSLGTSSVRALPNQSKPLAKNHFSVFPNPTTGDFYFEKNPNMDLSRLFITDIWGNRQRFELQNGSEQIYISPLGWKSGIYFLRSLGDSGLYFSKIVYLP